jgi:hypothetical protein
VGVRAHLVIDTVADLPRVRNGVDRSPSFTNTG